MSNETHHGIQIMKYERNMFIVLYNTCYIYETHWAHFLLSFHFLPPAQVT